MLHLHAIPPSPWLQQRLVASPHPTWPATQLKIAPTADSIMARLSNSPGRCIPCTHAKGPRRSLALGTHAHFDQVVLSSNISNRPSSSSLSGESAGQATVETASASLSQPSYRPHQAQQLGRKQGPSHHQHYTQSCASAKHPTLHSHWDSTNRIAANLTVVNPLRLIFGKPWRKAVPLSMLFFACTSIFTMLQSLKDGIVVMSMGADALPYLTTLGTLPASLVFFNFYRLNLAPSVAPQHLFMATAAPLLAFYTLFALLLYPVAPALHHPACLAWLPGVAPQGAAGLVAAMQQWLYSLFYVAADLWGPVMISLAFWTVADEVCSMSDAAQLYPQLGLLANLGLVGSGSFFKAVHAAVGGHMGAVLKVLVLCMLLMSGVMAGCIHNIYKRHISIIAEPQHHHHTHMKHSQQQQQHVAHKALDKQHHAAPTAAVHSSRHRHLPGSTQAGLQGIKSVLTRSPAAAALAVTVVAFSVSYRMFEYSYKNQLRLATADSAAYCCKLADVQSAVGAATIVLMLLSRFIFKHLGWSAAAFISPTAMLLAGIVFFACSLVNTSGAAAAAAGTNTLQHLSAISPVTAAAGLTETVSSMMSSIRGTGFPPLVDQQQVMWLGLGAGYVTALAASACHNSLFTPCKQMVYKIMPESEVKDSKAVVDLVGGQFAKSAAGWLVQALLLTCGSITAAQPAMAVVYISAVIAWLCANIRLSKDMSHYTAQQHASARKAAAEQRVEDCQEVRVSLANAQAIQYQPPPTQQQQQQLRRRPQQQAACEWPLPLPHDLAVVANSRQHAAHPSGGTDGVEYVVVGSNSSGKDFSSSSEQQDLVRNAGYWNTVYRQLADDPLLLEAVLQGRSTAAVQSRVGDAGTVHHDVKQQSKSAGSKKGSYTVLNGKEALHTYFDAY